MTSRGTKYWNSGTIPLIGPDILGKIIAEVADLGIVISEDGTILSLLINPNYDLFSRLEHLEGQNIRSALSVESVPKFNERLARYLDSEQDVRPLELNHVDADKRWEFPVRYSFHRIGPDGAILMLGRDLRPIAEMQQQLVKAQLALERDYEEQREFDMRFRVLMHGTTDAVFFLSVHSGRVTDANANGGLLVGAAPEELRDRAFSGLFESRKKSDLVERLTALAISDNAQSLTTTLLHGGEEVSIWPTLFRVSGERMLMCRVAPRDDGTPGTSPLVENLQSLYRKAPDAIVFGNADGGILSANDGFLNMIGAAGDYALKGHNLVEYLQRGSVDLKVMTENALRAGRMRMYATRVAGDYGSPRNVEISVTALKAGDEDIFAFIIRDATRVEGSRVSVDTHDDGMQSVVELVGSATLKEIVAETTSVVEKMCIETAVELTMNNRVAAAEMLGLSRQSLYVKLRKFGLLDRG